MRSCCVVLGDQDVWGTNRLSKAESILGTGMSQNLSRGRRHACIELLIGAMLTPAGFVTEAYLVVTMRNHWSSYYKWLQKGRWSWLGLSRQFVRLILKVVKQEVIHLVIDDTLTLRASKKAPGSQIHHQHGNKPNLAQYVRGQCWVSLAWVIRREKQPVALPLLTRLVPGISNTGKRVAAKTLIRAVYRLLDGRKVRVLVDSWYMRRILSSPCWLVGSM